MCCLQGCAPHACNCLGMPGLCSFSQRICLWVMEQGWWLCGSSLVCDSMSKVVALQRDPWLGMPGCDCGPKRKLNS